MGQSAEGVQITGNFQTIEKADQNTAPRHQTPATLIAIST
jgi:hypothetical protein